jgi:hypothetical protein
MRRIAMTPPSSPPSAKASSDSATVQRVAARMNRKSLNEKKRISLLAVCA